MSKLKLYSVEGVFEYWIVDHQQQAIEVYRREGGILKKAMTWFKVDRIATPLLPGFSYEVASLF
jgi:Uma2 family endonuclease